MLMSNVQLSGLCEEEAHNKGGGGDEGRQNNATNYTELFMILGLELVKEKLEIYGEIGSMHQQRPACTVNKRTRKAIY